MRSNTVRTKWSLAAVFGLIAALLIGYGGDAGAAGAGMTMVTLDCPSGRLTAMADATGKFRFPSVPDEACRLGVTSTGQPAAADVVAPRDPASGQATGKRQHKPVTFSVSVDGMPAASKTMSLDDWTKSPVSLPAAGRKHELTGHVTLMK